MFERIWINSFFSKSRFILLINSDVFKKFLLLSKFFLINIAKKIWSRCFWTFSNLTIWKNEWLWWRRTMLQTIRFYDRTWLESSHNWTLFEIVNRERFDACFTCFNWLSTRCSRSSKCKHERRTSSLVSTSKSCALWSITKNSLSKTLFEKKIHFILLKYQLKSNVQCLLKFEFWATSLMSFRRNTKIFEKFKMRLSTRCRIWFKTSRLNEIIFSSYWKELKSSVKWLSVDFWRMILCAFWQLKKRNEIKSIWYWTFFISFNFWLTFWASVLHIFKTHDLFITSCTSIWRTNSKKLKHCEIRFEFNFWFWFFKKLRSN